jgi:hypothetical protein
MAAATILAVGALRAFCCSAPELVACAGREETETRNATARIEAVIPNIRRTLYPVVQVTPGPVPHFLTAAATPRPWGRL